MYNFEKNILLTKRNTMHLDAIASLWAEFSDPGQLAEIMQQCKIHALPWYVLGGGSNIILTGNFPGVYIHPTSDLILREENTLLIADAGVVWDDFVAYCVEQGLWGVENLSLIPGQVGAAPIQNIGAYGSEAKDTIEWVEYLDTQTMKFEKIYGEDCRFGYRSSIFKEELCRRSVVIRVAFRLSSEPIPNLKYGDLLTRTHNKGDVSLENIRQAVIDIRREKLPDPDLLGNAGSFFKNPVITLEKTDRLKEIYPDIPAYPVDGGMKIPAAWLIEHAGWKGRRCGTVGVHDQQPLVLVNYGSATASEILSLSGRIQEDILRQFGIAIAQEVNIL